MFASAIFAAIRSFVSSAATLARQSPDFSSLALHITSRISANSYVLPFDLALYILSSEYKYLYNNWQHTSVCRRLPDINEIAVGTANSVNTYQTVSAFYPPFKRLPQSLCCIRLQYSIVLPETSMLKFPAPITVARIVSAALRVFARVKNADCDIVLPR